MAAKEMRWPLPVPPITVAMAFVALASWFLLCLSCGWFDAPKAPDPRWPCGSPRWEFCPTSSGINPSERTCCPMDHACRPGGACEFVGDPNFRDGPERRVPTRQKDADGGWVLEQRP